jgi:hypothetical protein
VNEQSASIMASSEILQPVEIEMLPNLAITLYKEGDERELLEEGRHEEG